MLRKISCYFLSGFIVTQLQAQQVEIKDTLDGNGEMPQVNVVAYRDKLLGKVPGSVTVVKFKEINKIVPISGNDVLRKVPGLNIVEEEGAGMRINIGVRGLDPDRSRSVLMLEDGIPVALNPYGEPEMYFTPVIDKVRTVEVLKGSGQILWGPQTIGGVVNFITANPPEKATTELRVRGGEGGFFSGYASHGNTVGNIGYHVSFLRKQANNIGPTQFHINDFSGKLRFKLSDKSSVGIKLGVYDEYSNSTYIGLTQTMYDAGGQDYVRMAPHDRLPVRRYNLSATHQVQFNPSVSLQTTAFAYTISRNWQRQDFSATPASNGTGVVWGDPSVPGGAIYMRNSNGHRDRQFGVMGIEPRLKIRNTLAGKDNTLQTGVRLLYEQANEQFVIGSTASASSGTVRDDEIRSGLALSGYAQDEIALTQKLTVHAGVRFENFNYDRRILRGRFPINGTQVVRDTNVLASSSLFELIPGAGFGYELNEAFTFFAGVHKGFAPPRTKDAITSTGMSIDLEAENSWNYEAGLRMVWRDWLSGEATLFMMDFQNQIIPISQSSGNANQTGLANGGRTLHKGIEAALNIDFGKLAGWKHSLTLGNNITYVDSRYNADRYLIQGGEKVNVKDNKLPYAPELMWNGNIGFEAAQGYGVRFYANYVSNQYTDELNTTKASANGRTGLIDSRMILDASAFYNMKNKKVSFNLSAKNITNERYIATRRPEGIRVGLPMMVIGGVDIIL